MFSHLWLRLLLLVLLVFSSLPGSHPRSLHRRVSITISRGRGSLQVLALVALRKFLVFLSLSLLAVHLVESLHELGREMLLLRIKRCVVYDQAQTARRFPFLFSPAFFCALRL